MNRAELIAQIKEKKSFLCVGLDTDIKKIPTHLLDREDPIFEFNKAIIDATKEFAVSYKINTAFYEAEGIKGWESMEKTLNYIPKEIFTIADAKRGDIGNTSAMYARAFFEHMDFDSITVAPYMGEDSVAPFLSVNEEKWVILLAATSNPGALNFQFLPMHVSKMKLFQKVLEASREWGNDHNMMYVVGATRPDVLKEVRAIVPDHFLLIPGVGAQGGSLEAVCENGMTNDIGLLINSSRGIIYSDTTEKFAEGAKQSARSIQQQMEAILKEKGIV